MASNNYIYKMSNAGGMATVTRYTDMLAGNTTWNPWEPQGAYDALSTVTVPSGGLASVTFAGIPSTYKHLQIRMIGRLNGAANNCSLVFNGDTGSNYTQHQLFGSGSSAGAGGSAYGVPSARPTFNMTGTNEASNIFGTGVMDILDYANTSKLKTVKLLTGSDYNGSGFIIMRSLLWNSTNAINSITFVPDSPSTGFVQYTQFTLYGVR